MKLLKRKLLGLKRIVCFSCILAKIYFAPRVLFPERKSHSELALADLYKDAPKGNMTSDEVYKAFDYDDDKPWRRDDK